MYVCMYSDNLHIAAYATSRFKAALHSSTTNMFSQLAYAVLNRKVFNCRLNADKEPADVTEASRLFYRRGPATANERSPAAVLARGTNKRTGELADRSRKSASVQDGCRM